LVLVDLVQSDSQTYRMRGADRLQFRLAIASDDDRFSITERLLQRLASNPKTLKAATG
jgi:hypothetical protein